MTLMKHLLRTDNVLYPHSFDKKKKMKKKTPWVQIIGRLYKIFLGDTWVQLLLLKVKEGNGKEEWNIQNCINLKCDTQSSMLQPHSRVHTSPPHTTSMEESSRQFTSFRTVGNSDVYLLLSWADAQHCACRY